MIYNGLRSQTCLQIKASKDFVQAIKVKFEPSFDDGFRFLKLDFTKIQDLRFMNVIY